MGGGVRQVGWVGLGWVVEWASGLGSGQVGNCVECGERESELD